MQTIHQSPPTACTISVIVPVLHEAVRINDHIAHIKALAAAATDVADVEILVVDPEGDTLAALAPENSGVHGGVRGVASPPGRARQMNAAAAAASGEILLFLHADTRLPEDGLQQVGAVLGPAVALIRLGQMPAGLPEAGAFHLAFDDEGLFFRLMAVVAGLRNRLLATPYGDQAQFFTARLFRELGGYPDLPLMEDVAIMHRVGRSGRRPVFAPGKAVTSARRYREEGVLFAAARNTVLRLLYGLGVPATRLARHYPRRRRT